jgi:hypothetical protein
MSKKLVFLLIAIFGLATTTFASYISLNTSLTSKIEGRNLILMISSINKGDESAFNVQAELQAAGKNILSKKVAELPINGTYATTERFAANYIKPGNYPVALILHYTDANQYPFSALTCQSAVYQKEAVSPLFGVIKAIAFSKEGKLKLTLKNSEEKEIKTIVSVVAPRELTVEDKVKELVLGPKSNRELEFSVTNFSALPGSSYQIYALIESDDAELHYTSIAPGTIKISSESPKTVITLAIIVIALLFIIFVLVNYFFQKTKA